MSNAAPDPKDPQFRSFRGGAWVLYLTFAVGFSTLIIVSVFKSVLAMSPEQPTTTQVSSEAECLRDGRSLFLELEQYRKDYTNGSDVAHADQRFLKFRVSWLQQKRAFEARCAVESRPAVKAAFSSLERVLDLYTTSSVQFSGGVGPAVDELKQQLDGR